MERRRFLKLALGAAAGAATIAASAQAAPLAPQPLRKDEQPGPSAELRPAVVTEDEVNRLKPEQVHWQWRRHHWHRRWRRHYW